jgi:hypothetical protein
LGAENKERCGDPLEYQALFSFDAKVEFILSGLQFLCQGNFERTHAAHKAPAFAMQSNRSRALSCAPVGCGVTEVSEKRTNRKLKRQSIDL